MSGMKFVQNVLPTAVPGPGGMDYRRLAIPEGPWNDDYWEIVPQAGALRVKTRQPCCVPDCGRPPFRTYERPHGEVTLCHPHYFQWYRGGRPDDVLLWAAESAREVDSRVRRVADRRGIDFAVLPPALAAEIRYTVGTKIRRAEWTPSAHIRRFLLGVVDVAVRYGMSSVLDRSLEEWDLLLRQRTTAKAYERTFGGFLRTFFATLTRGLLADPWAEDRWLWKGCFDEILHHQGNPPQNHNIRWDLINTEWLRDGAKSLARRLMMANERKWPTIINWVRGLRLLDDYLVEEGLPTPELLDRDVFLDFLAWVRESKNSKHNLISVTTTASILESLRLDKIVPELASEVYLRRGENTVAKPRNPKPYPADVIERVDRDIIGDPELDPTVRVMLRLARWAGPRISELVNLPIDILQRSSQGAFWVEYWMSKTKTWRRIPIPDDLGEEIRGQQDRVRKTFGDSANHLFPGARSKPGIGHTMPWTASGFRDHVRALFSKHEIATSALTGEVITGGEIHRYRHTVGTALLNNNWTQPEVQEFLGHVSATMTSHYAKITDDTLARKAAEFHRAQNNEAAAERLNPVVERLREKFSVVLPNGVCTLPGNMTCDFRPNPCLDCSFFRPEGDGVREANESHQRRLKVLVKEAHDAGDQKIVDLNQPMLDRLEHVLSNHDQEEPDA